MKKYILITGFDYLYKEAPDYTSFARKYTAFQEEDGMLIHEEGLIFFQSGFDTFENLKEKITDNSFISVLGRKTENKIEVSKLLEETEPPVQEILDFLEKQNEPQDFEDEILGLVKEKRNLCFFESKVKYGERNIYFYIDSKKEVFNAGKIYKNLDSYIDEAGRYTAEKMIDLANNWCLDAWLNEDNDEADYIPLTKEQFIERIFLTSVSVHENGIFEIWYNDDDIFWGHAVCVRGQLGKGYSDANIAG